jgi:hypothetical protein
MNCVFAMAANLTVIIQLNKHDEPTMEVSQV